MVCLPRLSGIGARFKASHCTCLTTRHNPTRAFPCKPAGKSEKAWLWKWKLVKLCLSPKLKIQSYKKYYFFELLLRVTMACNQSVIYNHKPFAFKDLTLYQQSDRRKGKAGLNSSMHGLACNKNTFYLQILFFWLCNYVRRICSRMNSMS